MLPSPLPLLRLSLSSGPDPLHLCAQASSLALATSRPTRLRSSRSSSRSAPSSTAAPTSLKLSWFVPLAPRLARADSTDLQADVGFPSQSDESINNVFGRTLNPHNTSLTAGGSSGGEAALLALHGSPLGLGTDLGGSVRKPAAFCGLYALRPTSRRLPYAGASNVFEGADALESVVGPMATSLESLRVAMRALVGARPWEHDAKVVERAWDDKLARAEGDKGKKCFAFMWSDGLVRPVPPLERGMRELAGKLRAAGHEGASLCAHSYARAPALG